MMCNHQGKDKETIKSAGWNKGFQNLFRISVDNFYRGGKSDLNNKNSSLRKESAYEFLLKSLPFIEV